MSEDILPIIERGLPLTNAEREKLRAEGQSMFSPMFVQQGWQCPVCQSVMAPSMLFCIFCKSQIKVEVKHGEGQGRDELRSDAGPAEAEAEAHVHREQHKQSPQA